MNRVTQLVVPTDVSLFGATLAAHGLAAWLDDVARRVYGSAKVRIANTGAALVVTADVAITPQQVQAAHFSSLLPWISTAKTGTPPIDSNPIDYEAEKQHNAEYYEQLKTLHKAGISPRQLPPEQRNRLDERAPRAYWPVAAVVNQMGALTAYNKAVERWAACRAVYEELAQIIWTLGSGQPHAVESAEAEWIVLAKQHRLDKSTALAATQAVNPEQGKGANRPKADALTIGGQESFWLLEYFKFLGLHHAALPRTVLGREDRKTYVVVPSRDGLEWYWHKRLFSGFQKEFWTTSAIKMDIQAALRYTDQMIKEWDAAQQSNVQRHPSDFVDGFVVASFKKLGSAPAVMNVATLRLPDWIDVPQNQQQAERARGIVAEHLLIITRLDESRGEEEHMLRTYRDFLSSRDPNLTALWEFTSAYAGHTLRRMSKRERVQQLSTANVGRIIMANDERREQAGMLPLAEIVNNVGFRNIAAAIRASTVTQQYREVKHGDRTYDIRYGLADDLRRKSRDPREFVQELSKFLHQYGQENERVRKRFAGKKYRTRIAITPEDIDQVIKLVDEYDSPTIASLLIAYGYATDFGKREGDNEEADALEQEHEAPDDTFAATDEAPF